MTTTEIELVSPTGDQGFLEANKNILEQCAVQALMAVMNSNCAPEVKLSASAQAFDILGKSKPALVAQGNTTNIQINSVLASKAGDALAGVVKALTLMGSEMSESQSTSVIMPPKEFHEATEA